LREEAESLGWLKIPNFTIHTPRGVTPSDLGLFAITEGLNPRVQELIDFGSIEQVAATLERNLRTIVKNDARSQHHTSRVSITGEHGKEPSIPDEQPDPK
jgi:hypothetical protein